MAPSVVIPTVRSRGGYARFSEFALVTVRGDDAADFLESQLPADIHALPHHEGQLTARLDRRGRIQCLVIVVSVREGFWLITDRRHAEALRTDLEHFHIREEVSIQILEDLELWDLAGPCLPELIQDTLGGGASWDPYSCSAFDVSGVPVYVVSNPWTGDLAGHLIVPTSQGKDVWDRLEAQGDTSGWAVMDAPTREVLLMEGGWPRTEDLGDKALISELGREDAMVSFSKGCYLGQESVARVHARGKVRRHFVGVLGDGVDLFSPDAFVHHEGTPVGEVGRSVWSPSLERVIGFAWIRQAACEPGTVVHVGDKGNLRPATICRLPFYRKMTAGEASSRLYRQGMSAFQLDAYQTALNHFEKSVLLNPGRVDAYEAMGICYERMNDLVQATRLMEELAEMAPDHVMAWVNLSRYYAKAGNIQEAEVAKEKAAYLEWKHAVGESEAKQRAHDQAQLDRSKAEDRLELFRRVLDLDAEDVVANFGLGKLHLDRGEFSEAEPLLRKAISIKGDYSMAYNHLAACLVGLDCREEAGRVLERGIDIAKGQGDLMPKRDMERRLLELTR